MVHQDKTKLLALMGLLVVGGFVLGIGVSSVFLSSKSMSAKAYVDDSPLCPCAGGGSPIPVPTCGVGMVYAQNVGMCEPEQTTPVPCPSGYVFSASQSDASVQGLCLAEPIGPVPTCAPGIFGQAKINTICQPQGVSPSPLPKKCRCVNDYWDGSCGESTGQRCTPEPYPTVSPESSSQQRIMLWWGDLWGNKSQ